MRRRKHVVISSLPVARLRVVRRFKRRSRRGWHESYVEVECVCGTRRVLLQSIFNNRCPQSCKRCRLRAIKLHGFEAEYAR